MAKQNGISGRRALAQALVWRMARDREEGLASKKNKTFHDSGKDFDVRLEMWPSSQLLVSKRTQQALG